MEWDTELGSVILPQFSHTSSPDDLKCTTTPQLRGGRATTGRKESSVKTSKLMYVFVSGRVSAGVMAGKGCSTLTTWVVHCPCQGSQDERGGCHACVKVPKMSAVGNVHQAAWCGGSRLRSPRQRPPPRCKLMRSKSDMVTANSQNKTVEQSCRTSTEKEGVSLFCVWVPQSRVCAFPRLRNERDITLPPKKNTRIPV